MVQGRIEQPVEPQIGCAHGLFAERPQVVGEPGVVVEPPERRLGQQQVRGSGPTHGFDLLHRGLRVGRIVPGPRAVGARKCHVVAYRRSSSASSPRLTTATVALRESGSASAARTRRTSAVGLLAAADGAPPRTSPLGLEAPAVLVEQRAVRAV